MVALGAAEATGGGGGGDSRDGLAVGATVCRPASPVVRTCNASDSPVCIPAGQRVATARHAVLASACIVC